MNRELRSQDTHVEGALRRYEEDLAAAERRAVARLQRVGFNFATIQQVQAYAGKMRKLRRQQAELIADAAAFADMRTRSRGRAVSRPQSFQEAS